MGTVSDDGQQDSRYAAEASQPAQGGLDQIRREHCRSLRGRDAQFGSATDEVERVLAIQKNYYAVLKVKKDTPSPEVRQNYFKLSRLVHPDKCSHAQAKDASAAVNQAYDTLSSTVKKTLYDQYVDDAGDLDAPAGMSYAEWESQRGEVQIPKWMEKILRIPGGGICLLLILLPLTLLLLLVFFVAFLLCLPVRLALQLCCGAKLQPPPGHHPPATADDEDVDENDRDVVIDIPPETAAPTQETTAGGAAKEAQKGSSGAGHKAGDYHPPSPV
ncbi:g11088 [Coccomyxa viridis]|uniref:G11088 protein n=1 Tax=Coccomyxa viridis TaxID=1274662 RepID=A0ABP1G9N1_9CHLO